SVSQAVVEESERAGAVAANAAERERLLTKVDQLSLGAQGIPLGKPAVPPASVAAGFSPEPGAPLAGGMGRMGGGAGMAGRRLSEANQALGDLVARDEALGEKELARKSTMQSALRARRMWNALEVGKDAKAAIQPRERF